MSVYHFFASDYPIKEKANTNVELISIEEAEARGIQLPNWYNSSMNIDKVAKCLLYAPNEDSMHEIDIKEDYHFNDSNKYSNRRNKASLSWRYSHKRGLELIKFIEDHLETAPQIELWSIWLDDYESPTIKSCKLKELTTEMLEQDFGGLYFSHPVCLNIIK